MNDKSKPTIGNRQDAELIQEVFKKEMADGMMIFRRHSISILAMIVFIIIACDTPDKAKVEYDVSKEITNKSRIHPVVQEKDKLVAKPWSDSILWESLLKTKSHASFSVKINDKLPEFNFKIVGKMKGEYFHPSHVEITNTYNGKPIQKLMGKNRFDHQDFGWNENDSFIARLIQIEDLNNDGYLDLMILIWAGITGNNAYAIYLYDIESGKFKYHHELSRLLEIRVDNDSKLISSYSRSGWCYESMGYYSITGNKLILSKIEWTEMDRTRDKEVGGPACFKYSGVPHSKNIMIVPDDFILALYKNKLPYLRKKLKNVKEEPLLGSLDQRDRNVMGVPYEKR